MSRLFGSFFPNLGIWIQGSGATVHMASTAYFLNFFKDKERRFKTKLTLNLILRFNLRLGGYSIWSASLIAPRIKEEDLQTSRDLSTSQSRSSQPSTRKTPSGWSSEELEDTLRSTRKPAVLDYEELGGLVGPGAIGLRTWRTYSRIKDGTWPTPYTSYNYSYKSRTSRNRRKLPE
jgi:hypothetical protein